MTCRLSGYDTELMLPQMLEIVDRYDVDGFWVDGEGAAAFGYWWDAIGVRIQHTPTAAELVAALTQAETELRSFRLPTALASDEPCIIGLGGVPPPSLPAWPADRAFEPGRGRSIADGSSATLVCGPDGLAAALAARDRMALDGADVGVLHLSSLAPLPAELAEAPAPLAVGALAAQRLPHLPAAGADAAEVVWALR